MGKSISFVNEFRAFREGDKDSHPDSHFIPQ